jgi:contact-dependent growth inhibition (CDI) system CdiI-like immunity protein
MTRYPTLWHFFGGYLHEDWRDDYDDEWAAIDGFIADGPPEDPVLFRAEIAQLLTEHSSEEDVRKIVLDDLGSYLLVEVDGWKYRDWLQALSDHVAKATGHPQAS